MSILSIALVTIQMVLIWLLLTPVSVFFQPGIAGATGLVLLLAALLVGLWAVLSLSCKNLSVMPEPVQQGTLIQHGPYRYIRHPMYSALIIGGFGAVIAYASLLKALFLLLLVSVLVIKLKREESLLTLAYPDYRVYMQRTAALCPQIF